MKIKRLLSMLIDYIVAIIIAMVAWTILDVAIGNEIWSLKTADFYMWFAWSLFTLKDIVFKNYSVGKKKFGIEIRTDKDEIPSLLIIVLRNLPLILLPLEIILIIICNKRLGDILFKTKVVDNSTIK